MLFGDFINLLWAQKCEPMRLFFRLKAMGVFRIERHFPLIVAQRLAYPAALLRRLMEV